VTTGKRVQVTPFAGSKTTGMTDEELQQKKLKHLHERKQTSDNGLTKQEVGDWIDVISVDTTQTVKCFEIST
jgi:hypothetical protein